MDWHVRDVAVAVGLLAVYVTIMTSLALTVDRRFFINDGISVTFWVITGVVLAYGTVHASRHP
ncbi:MAG: hypothetical protein WC273_07015 [Dehalococcoidia bacterium]